MYCETVDLYQYFNRARDGREGGILNVYCRERMGDLGKKIRPAMLVIPGGGYSYCSEREREPVALRFLAEGYAAFTLLYSVKRAYPDPLLEGAMAMIYIRENAEKYGVDPRHVAAVGFSAGGHLAGMLAELYGEAALKEAFGARAELVRPDAVVLSYPVVSTGVFSHSETAKNISGGDGALKEKLSLEKRVTKESSPLFLWHTGNDDCVPVENAFLLAEAYRRAGAPFELHLFERGRHGSSVAGIETEESAEEIDRLEHLAVWLPLALKWLETRGFSVRL